MKCEWRKIGGDYFEVCTKEVKQPVSHNKGDTWSKVMCWLTGSHFTMGSEYDIVTDTCTTKGKFINLHFWR